jgi:hypothetical protein
VNPSLAQKIKIMKHRNLRSFLRKIRQVRQKGQALVEFILLLVILSGVSFTFVAFMNRSLSRYWEYSVNLIIDDKPGTKTVGF